MAHFAAVLPNHIWMEVVDAGRDVVFDHDSKVEDGWIVLGDRPGNGIEFDEAKLEQYRVTERSMSAAPSPWGQAAWRGFAYPVARWRTGRDGAGVGAWCGSAGMCQRGFEH